MNKRGRWIVKKRLHFEQFPKEELKKRYVSGETHRYLGRQYRLKVIDSQTNNVKMKGRYIEVYTYDQSPEFVELLLYEWNRTHAEIKFNDILDEAMKVVIKYGIKRPEMKIKRMKKRWGSCVTWKEQDPSQSGINKDPSLLYRICYLS